jgi:PKHD-type hydroxylase
MTTESFSGGSSFTELGSEKNQTELISPPNAPIPDKLKNNPQLTSIVHSLDFLSDKQCSALINSAVEEIWEDGDVVGENKDMRSCKQQGLPMNPEGWPYTYILEIIKHANEMKYNFDLSGFMNIDSPMLMKYSKKDHYDWHIDVGAGLSNRKLSFTIQLTDSDEYEGGDIEFLGIKTKTEEFRKKGTIVIFPSFIPHRVTPIKKGVRHAIVGWVHGNSFV